MIEPAVIVIIVLIFLGTLALILYYLHLEKKKKENPDIQLMKIGKIGEAPPPSTTDETEELPKSE